MSFLWQHLRNIQTGMTLSPIRSTVFVIYLAKSKKYSDRHDFESDQVYSVCYLFGNI